MKRYLYVLLIVALFALQACATDAAPMEGDEAGQFDPAGFFRCFQFVT
ncbi:MAG: hypothetical protein IPP55_04660 [Anaerolineales bacterium]|nr:hypothetical protein [Anaerolineales bacterium]